MNNKQDRYDWLDIFCDECQKRWRVWGVKNNSYVVVYKGLDYRKEIKLEAQPK
jgi:hypothetical protein